MEFIFVCHPISVCSRTRKQLTQPAHGPGNSWHNRLTDQETVDTTWRTSNQLTQLDHGPANSYPRFRAELTVRHIISQPRQALRLCSNMDQFPVCFISSVNEAETKSFCGCILNMNRTALDKFQSTSCLSVVMGSAAFFAVHKTTMSCSYRCLFLSDETYTHAQ